ncbi:hypothetical protein [Paracoccus liaowanqingii]|uniref:hypothetical protein n=1 Tax=Paracoccus liaowanqingii TaxID=2560053 RepID=UPI00159BEA24|nr:hypothetical protein [Paracoccus liaowanqingii]
MTKNNETGMGKDREPRHENAQGSHHGVPHKPEDFDVMNPAKMDEPKTETPKKP